MELIFTKRGGKYDDLVIRRAGAADEAIACPKQGIVPHDMVHFAVESVLAQRGFLSLVKDGEPAGYGTRGDDGAEAIERLVETFQAELWGGRVPAAALIATYQHACAARGHAASPVTPDAVDAIRTRLDDLTARWSAVAINEALVLRF
ncbi:hypothetical protein J2Y58_000802 [Sphingomonas sp. BE138]|uniref:hypothetical protein n=1 Tax=Sphingomonas sp. BE138 TaxID=2817845 RepID=UPI002861014D|nr:hypothetical protein [Sphingomonas sp. BE138]MDR6787461.1 hypothetical protein [Sphingomonas sp. BE138]